MFVCMCCYGYSVGFWNMMMCDGLGCLIGMLFCVMVFCCVVLSFVMRCSSVDFL